MGNRTRLLVVGLDGLAPAKVFFDWRADMPFFGKLMAEGAWGTLRSCHPPITVPAWTCMFSGRDPGELGCYGFRTRAAYSYDSYELASSRSVPFPRVWERIRRHGLRSLLIGVPQTYPPPRCGTVVSCFLTPPGAERWTSPPELAGEILGRFGPYTFDVRAFRSREYSRVLQDAYEKTKKDFALVRYLCGTRSWELCIFVEIAVDRIQHAFWSFCDPAAEGFEPGGPFASVVRDYYRFLDGQLEELVDALGPETSILVVSDHGARHMEGGVCVNEWLAARGFLRLAATPPGPAPLSPDLVDWGRTVAWADGGYCGRIYLNVRGREPRGVVARGEYERVRSEIVAAFGEITESGIQVAAHRPEELYKTLRGCAPDLIVYFGDLGWRALASVGHRRFWTRENDGGPDGANHDWYGVWIYRPTIGRLGGKYIEGMTIERIADLVLSEFGLADSPLRREGGDDRPRLDFR